MKSIFAFSVCALALAFPVIALADAVTVDSFSASPTSVSYAFGTQLSWSTAGQSPDFYLFCPAGVTIKGNNGTIPCNTTTTLGQGSDNVPLSIVNLTGSTKVVSIRITPKDSSGTRYPDNARSLSLSVSPVPQPIADFASSSSTPVSGTPVTLTWIGIETPGVNLQFDCTSDIKVFSGNSANVSSALSCGKMAFTNDLARSGSQIITFVNNSLFAEQIGVRVIPSIVSDSYDGTHGVSLSLSVQPKPAAQEVSISNFSASNSAPVSGSPVTFSWAMANADAANIQFSCDPSIKIANVTSTTSIPLRCATPAFSHDLSLASTTVVSFTNSGVAPVSVSALLLPRVGTVYDATHARSLSLSVLIPGNATASVSSAVQLPTQSVSGSAVPPMQTSTGNIKAVHTVTFSVALQKGSRGAQVTALQQFLAQDPSLYPEGSATGYFGAATQAALQRFQVRYGVAQAGDAGYGTFGPKTRTKANGLIYF